MTSISRQPQQRLQREWREVPRELLTPLPGGGPPKTGVHDALPIFCSRLAVSRVYDLDLAPTAAAAPERVAGDPQRAPDTATGGVAAQNRSTRRSSDLLLEASSQPGV